MDTMTSMRIFCAIAECRSFVAAAKRLNLSPAMASKHVRHLEQRLGNRLLNRTSRQVSLTEVGEIYFNQVKLVMEGLDDVEAVIGSIAKIPHGTLKLSAPVWVASASFATLLAEYCQQCPEICLDIDLSGRIVNLVEEGFDLALRATSADRLGPGLVARPLMQITFRLMASPDYLNRAGRPTSIAELNGHALLRYSGLGGRDGMFLGDAGDKQRVAFRTVMQSENETILHQAALAGLGVVFLPTWMARADITAGRLELLLAPTVNVSTKLYAVYSSRRYLSPKVRSIIDFLADRGRYFEALDEAGGQPPPEIIHLT